MISSFIFIPNEVDAKDRNYDGISTDTPPRCRDRIILSDIELHWRACLTMYKYTASNPRPLLGVARRGGSRAHVVIIALC